MLVAESITNEKGLEPYWNEVCKENNSKLWLPAKTDWQDSATTYWNGFSPKTVAKSWFSTKFLSARVKNGIYSQPYTYFPNCTDSGSTKKQSRKIRVYPTEEQKQIFNKWFGASRYCYNKAVEICKGENKLYGYKLRDKILSELPEWAKEIPFKIKAESVLDFDKASKAAWSAWNKNGGTPPTFRFKSRKNPKQSCPIVKAAFSGKNGIHIKHSGVLRSIESLISDGDGRLLKENGRYYVVVIKLTEPISCDKQTGKGIVAIDPGVRTFATFYSGDAVGKIGENDFKRVYNLCRHVDELISKRTKSRNHRQRTALKKAIHRVRWR